MECVKLSAEKRRREKSRKEHVAFNPSFNFHSQSRARMGARGGTRRWGGRDGTGRGGAGGGDGFD